MSRNKFRKVESTGTLWSHCCHQPHLVDVRLVALCQRGAKTVDSRLFSTITAFHCLRQWFPPDLKHPLSIAHVILFWLWPVMIFYNFFRAMFVGPGSFDRYDRRRRPSFLIPPSSLVGFVPRRWKPVADEDEKYMQHCKHGVFSITCFYVHNSLGEICQGFKAPRAHHCKKCDRCVMKLDHHVS